MPDHEIDVDALMMEVLALVHKHGLRPGTFGLTLVIPRKEFKALARQYPNHRPEMIRISKGNDWSIKFFPVLEPGDYPTGEALKPDSFRDVYAKPQRKPKPKTKKRKTRL